jgi:hypothetical protein
MASNDLGFARRLETGSWQIITWVHLTGGFSLNGRCAPVPRGCTAPTYHNAQRAALGCSRNIEMTPPLQDEGVTPAGSAHEKKEAVFAPGLGYRQSPLSPAGLVA